MRMENENTNSNESLSQYKFTGVGLSTTEKRWAKKRFEDYQLRYHIDNLSDLQLLDELVFRESLQERYKRKIGSLHKDLKKKKDKGEINKEPEIIPKHILNALDDNLERILTLKDKLGLFEEKKDKDEFKAFEVLEKKFKIWKADHLEERKVTCPFCSEIFFLNIRTDKYKESTLKLFKNKVLCNAELWKVFKAGKINKEEFAQILNVSTDYIDWLEAKIYNKSSK